jgi:hypothetical protein
MRMNRIFAFTCILMLLMGSMLAQTVQPYDILINEFMPAPVAKSKLPNVEYIELHNRLKNKKDSINLEGFTIWNGSDSTVLPNYRLEADSFVIIYTQKKDEYFKPYCKDTIALPTSKKLITLSNPTDVFYLVSRDKRVIDAASYDLTFYQGKGEAGLALERTRINARCDSLAWAPSRNPQMGTPGKKNSVFNDTLDTTPPLIERYYLKDSMTIILVFNKSLNRDLAKDLSNYEIFGGEGIESVYTIAPFFKVVKLILKSPLKSGFLYKLNVKKTLTDCQNIPLSVPLTLEIRLRELPKKESNDLIINEILVNPESGGSRFVELYNNSSKKAFDIADLQIRDTIRNDVKFIKTNFLLLPKQYVVLTDKPDYVRNRYKMPDSLKFHILKNSLPVWKEDSGSISITVGPVEIDKVNYLKSWHNPLLATTDGVSLERLNPNLPSSDSTNWQSASEKSGFATPAQKNSQFRIFQKDPSVSSPFWLEKNTFSPDEDGFEDALLIRYKLEKSGGVANIQVFDSNGRFVKTLSINELLGTEGVIRWQSERTDGIGAKVGIYILVIETVFPNGSTIRQKLPFALTTQF